MGEACDNRRGGVVREAREVPFVSSTAYSFHVKQILFTCSNGRWFALECYDGWARGRRGERTKERGSRIQLCCPISSAVRAGIRRTYAVWRRVY